MSMLNVKRIAIFLVTSLTLNGCASAVAIGGFLTVATVSEMAKVPRFHTRIGDVRALVIPFTNSCSYGSLTRRQKAKTPENAGCATIKFAANAKLNRAQKLQFAKQLVASEPGINWPPRADAIRFERLIKSDNTLGSRSRYFRFPFVAKDRPAKWRKVRPK